MSPGTPKFQSLESLRGLAAFAVFLTHVPWVTAVTDNNFIHNTQLMVDLFFVISGFVIYHSYGHKISSPQQFGKFMGLRIGRLYPLHLFMLPLFLGIAGLKYFAEIYFHLKANTPPFPPHAATSFLANLLCFQWRGTEYFTAWNPPSWSITVEFILYILFGLGMLLRSRTGKGLATAPLMLIAALSLSLLTLCDLGSLQPHVDMLRGLSGFVLGMLACQLQQHVNQGKFWSHRIAVLMNILICTVFAVSILSISLKTGPHLFAVYFYLLFALLVFGLAALPQHHGINRILTLPPFLWLGQISYSIYLTHVAVLWFFTQFMRVVLKVPAVMQNGEAVITPPPGMANVFLLSAVAAVLLFSHLSNRYIENYFRLKSRQWLES